MSCPFSNWLECQSPSPQVKGQFKYLGYDLVKIEATENYNIYDDSVVGKARYNKPIKTLSTNHGDWWVEFQPL